MSVVIDLFRKYIHIPSASDEASTASPTTPEQVVLAKILADDMRKIGLSHVTSNEDGYAFGTVPANCECQPSIGLIAHLDVVNSSPCEPMNERVIENYDGSVIVLANGLTIDPAEYTALKDCVGKDLIVTDGNTILGADDKAALRRSWRLQSV